MRRRNRFQNSLNAGAVSPEYLQTADEDLLENALKTLLNAIGINAGGVIRRPGSYDIAGVTERRKIEFFDRPDGSFYIVAFKDGGADIYDPDDGSLIDTVSGPWGSADLDTMQIEPGKDLFWIYSNSFYPRVMSFDGSSFSVGFETFASSVGGGLAQPYYRFADPGISLTPGALTGNGIALTFSDDVLTSDYVNTRIRYLGNEIIVKTVTNATTGTGDVVSSLYPTVNVTVASNDPFKVDHVVQGSVTGVNGRVTNISGTTITVLLTDGYSLFDASTPDKLQSPEGESAISAVAATTPAATTLWDEQMISDARGYPGAVVKHRQRKVIANFPDAPDAIAFSSLGFPNDYNLGDGGASDALIEELGGDENASIRHLVSDEQMLIGTDRDIYYIPESEQSPIVPGSVEFKRFSTDGISKLRPRVIPEGVVFVDTVDRLLIAVKTGNVRASWAVSELSQLSPHLITNPTEISYVDGVDGRPERYLIVRNGTTDAAVFAYRRGAEQVGAGQWTLGNSGKWGSFAARQNRLFCAAEVASGWRLCEMSFAAIIDAQISYASAVTALDGDTVHVLRDDVVFAEAEVGTVTTGLIDGIPAASNLSVGFDFNVEVTPASPVAKNVGFERKRISEVWADVLNTGPFRIAGMLVPGYNLADDLEAAPALRSGPLHAFCLGLETENLVPITQPIGEGSPFLLRSVTQKVAA